MENLVIRKANLEELKNIQDLNHDLFASDGPRDKYLNHNWPYEDGNEKAILVLSKNRIYA